MALLRSVKGYLDLFHLLILYFMPDFIVRRLSVRFFRSLLFQSTMVVLQALSEYMIKRPSPDDLSLDVDIRITGRRDIRYHFNPRTAYGARSSKVRDIKRDINRIQACSGVS